MLILTLTAPGRLLAESGDSRQATLWDTTRENSARGWEATRAGTGKALDWTAEKSRRGWEKTTEIASDGTQWSREESSQAWKATKTGAAKAPAG